MELRVTSQQHVFECVREDETVCARYNSETGEIIVFETLTQEELSLCNRLVKEFITDDGQENKSTDTISTQIRSTSTTKNKTRLVYPPQE